jgi:hypothetical protein
MRAPVCLVWPGNCSLRCDRQGLDASICVDVQRLHITVLMLKLFSQVLLYPLSLSVFLSSMIPSSLSMFLV